MRSMKISTAQLARICGVSQGTVDRALNNRNGISDKTKKMIRKAFEKQMAGEGFTFVEVLAPCPTNWGMTPVQSCERIQNELFEKYPLGEFVERSAK